MRNRILLHVLLGLALGLVRPDIGRAQEPSTAPQPGRTTGAEASPEGVHEAFKRHYEVTKEQAVVRFTPPFSASRRDFFRQAVKAESARAPDGPHAWVLHWKDNTPVSDACFLEDDFMLQHLLIMILDLSDQQVRGDQQLREMRLPGDFIFNAAASVEARRAALERILQQELGKPLHLRLSQVEEETLVFAGTWQFATAENTDEAASEPLIDIYADGLDVAPRKPFPPRGGRRHLESALSRWLGEPVLIETKAFPKVVRWHIHTHAGEAPERQAAAKDKQQTLDHLQEQTGMTWSRQQRTNTYLFIEQEKP